MLRLSTGARNFLNSGGSLRQAFNGGKIQGYTGTQPATGDGAASGILLVTFTSGGAAHTNEVLASGATTLVGTAGSVTSFSVNGIDLLMSASVAFNTSLTQTAADVATDINRNPANTLFVASSSGETVTITAKPGLGAAANTWALTPIGTGGITFTGTANMASGVTSVNGLNWEMSSGGVLVKRTDETWSGTAVADGNIGWYRRLAAVADAGGVDSAATYLRMDGSAAASGVQLNGSTSIEEDAVITILSAQLTMPAQ